MAKLSALPKKKNHDLFRCTTKFEPLVDQLIDSPNEHITNSLIKLFYNELEVFENSIKGPHYLGHFSWVKNEKNNNFEFY